jgi:endo-1,4-beta-xylanase
MVLRLWPRFLLLLIFPSFAVLPNPPSLRQVADRAGVLAGTAVRTSQLSEPAYASTLGREYNMVEAEDAMKWWVVRRDPAKFDFHDGDAIVSFAEAHEMKVRGHCLVWARDNPDWLAHGSFTSAELSRMLHEHITTVMKHYQGQVFAWDVVNEALNENGKVRDSLWYNQPGIGFAGQGTKYIEQAFRWAHETDPHALLFYNEAEGEGLSRKSDAIFEMVKDFRQRGVPIDGVGLQLHIPKLDFDGIAVTANIARLTALGVQVHITELDVALPIDALGSLARKEGLADQAVIYRDVTRACLQSSGCTAIQTWGFTDKYSWIGSHSHGTRGGALPFDRDYQPKPAYQAMLDQISAGRGGGR